MYCVDTGKYLARVIHLASVGGPRGAPLGSDNLEIFLHGVTNHLAGESGN
jgi:hypothetical protein